ncbi:hypothetical protein IPH67_05680 [bacterium]|nr:MAG: hypothetical protein IPH67_05680 [bacterium]
MKLKKALVSFFYILFSIALSAQPIIQLHFVQDKDAIQKRMLKKLQTKNQLASEQLSSLIGKNKTAGFCACYAGFIGVSNHEGYINFTRKHATPVIYLAITQEIVPVMRESENTVSHWQFL